MKKIFVLKVKGWRGKTNILRTHKKNLPAVGFCLNPRF